MSLIALSPVARGCGGGVWWLCFCFCVFVFVCVDAGAGEKWAKEYNKPPLNRRFLFLFFIIPRGL